MAVFVLLATPARAVDIQELTSPSGISAWLVEDHTLPFVALEIRFRGGTSLDAPGKRGATYFMAGLLEEGAADMDAAAFAARRESLGAVLSFDAYDDAVSVSARFLTENRAPSADLLRAALVQPRFDPEAIERVRAQILSIIAAREKDPDEIATETLDRLAFDGHPYGSAPEGTVDSVTALSRDDLVAAWRGAIARDRLVIGAAGDITGEELGRLLDRVFGDLPAKGAPMPPDAPWRLSGGTTVVPFPSPQSIAYFAQRGLRRHDPDFIAAYVLNHILGGGGFGSILMQEIREKRGLTYGVGTYLVPKDHAELLIGRVASSNETIAEAIALVRQIWERVARGELTAEELDAAKRYLTGAYPLRFDGNGNIARILVGMQLDRMPASYVNERNALVEAVTLDDLRRVARRLLDPEGLHFVVVGQPEGLD